MTDAASILQDINLAFDLFAKITTNLVAAKDSLSATDLASARAKYAAIKTMADQVDAEFDAALAASQE